MTEYDTEADSTESSMTGPKAAIVSLLGGLGLIALLVGIFTDFEFGVGLIVAFVFWITSGALGAAWAVGPKYAKRKEEVRYGVSESPEYSPNTPSTPMAGLPFFCQVDGKTHPATDTAFQCKQCGRFICDNCFQDLVNVVRPSCPMCDGAMARVSGHSGGSIISKI